MAEYRASAPLPRGMTPRTIRAANRMLYLSCVLMVIGACVYTLLTRELLPIYVAGIILAGYIATLWGLRYFVLSYRIDAQGVTCTGLLGRKHLAWEQISHASLQKTDSNGVASVQIILRSPETELCLSSELLTPDDVEDLASELKEKGILS